MVTFGVGCDLHGVGDAANRHIMKRRRAVPAQINFTRHRVAAGSITLPTHWSPEQAVAVFEILDELRDRIWERYGQQIQLVLRAERSKAIPAAGDFDIDEADVPF